MSRPAQVVSDVRTVYDNPTLAQTWPLATPSKGDIFEVLDATGYANSQFTYQVKSAALYDSTGRVTASYDGNGNKTATAYTVSSYGLTTAITTTNPLGQTSSVTLDPLRRADGRHQRPQRRHHHLLHYDAASSAQSGSNEPEQGRGLRGLHGLRPAVAGPGPASTPCR